MARLELVDAVVSVIVREQLRKELSFSEIEKTFWMDSQVVPSYLANEYRKFHIFLANINRVQELREKTSVNPNQQTKRLVIFMQETSTSQNGSGGPHSLLKEEWPKYRVTEIIPLSSDDPEVKRISSCATSAKEMKASPDGLIYYFYDWYKAKRAIAMPACKQG